MTEPVQGVPGTGAVAPHGSGGEGGRQQRPPRRPLSDADEKPQADADTVELSDEARRRADGSWRKTILEYLGDGR